MDCQAILRLVLPLIPHPAIPLSRVLVKPLWEHMDIPRDVAVAERSAVPAERVRVYRRVVTIRRASATRFPTASFLFLHALQQAAADKTDPLHGSRATTYGSLIWRFFTPSRDTVEIIPSPQKYIRHVPSKGGCAFAFLGAIT